jgi:hypothetical protein
MIVNTANIGFWKEPLAKVVFVTFMLSVMLMMELYSRFRSEKNLGIGYLLWIQLLVYVLMEIRNARDTFKSYLVILIISIPFH